MARDETDIISGIYEASFVPELWRNVISDMATLTDTFGGVMFVEGAHGFKWTATDNMRPIMQGFVDGGFNTNNTRTANRLRCNRAGFLNEFDLYSKDQLEVEPMYVRHFRPIGLGWSASTAICSTSQDIIVFDLEQRFDKGPIGRDTLSKLDDFRPHIARAALVASRLGMKQAHSAVGAFQLVGLPAAVITRTGRVLAANELLENLPGQVKIVANDKLHFENRSAQDVFLRAAAHGGLAPKAVLSFALPATEEAPAAVAQVIPLKGVSNDIFARGDAVLLISPLSQSAAPHADVVAALFDLTPAEARVARGIASGLTAEGIAASLSLSPHTVRSQVKAVLAKVGVKRKIELANLLGSVSTRFGTH
ncbi:bacterial regulatory proteins, luxR family [Variibacter gotjawalensis]|uniref:Bacterial regulatory proteins, luxR family n=1 Tax=Variibacter gotjawalensis TaxID=1333996 RepID=A0A0S3PTZ9_9BRAD|nr:helix-turn-helix transcriptional regulator [Variibacter gotjawalensis]NIK49673.1 DNA-binding CsgD family transcriptional regulator [Variibacter gotjawalensis]RZS45685.1 DNA-binding CsgD family transcriptional regulator [Variibacter gotjawalensis]BAT59356.1 bacterial regulatory proteins, luxR family [Variibacter gotjawalensis]